MHTHSLPDRSRAVRRAMSWTLTFVLAVLLGGGAWAQSLGDPPSAFLDATGAAHVEDGTYRVGSWSLRPEARDELLVRATLEGTLDEAGITVASEVLAIATGYGAGIEDGIARFLSDRAGELAGRGEVAVSVEAYRLGVDVRGEDPFDATLTLERPRLSAEAFPDPVATLGPSDAPVLVREFSDFQCPFCRRYAQEILPGLKENLLADGEVAFAFHHFPLDSIHANASPAAEAAQCVRDDFGEEAFWAYHDLLFARQEAWQDLGDPAPYFARLVREVDPSALNGEDGVGEARATLATCLEEERAREAVARATRAAGELGLSGTPSVFVGGFRLNEFNDPAAYGRLVRLERAYARSDGPEPVLPVDDSAAAD